MNSSNPSRTELSRLFGEAIHGAIAESDLKRLRKYLNSCPQARAQWIEAVETESLLICRDAPPLNPILAAASADDKPTPPANVFMARFTQSLLWAASITVAALIGWKWTADNEPKKQPAARVTAANEALWAETDQSIQSEAPIYPGTTLQLLSGSVDVLFNSGAVVHLEGPAIFQVRSSNSAYLTVGSARTSCKTASSRGFSLQTPSARVVDLGTEFETVTTADGTSRVNVIAGEVRVHLPFNQQERYLSGGESFSIPPEQDKISIRIESGDASTDFRLPSIDPPFSELKFACEKPQVFAQTRADDSASRRNSGNSTQNLLQNTSPLPSSTVVGDGTVLVDLGAQTTITKINTYSQGKPFRLGSTRLPSSQRFTIYGSPNHDGLKPPQANDLSLWQRITEVRGDRFFEGADQANLSSQQACSITASSGCIGSFRYLLVIPVKADTQVLQSAEMPSICQINVYSDPWKF